MKYHCLLDISEGMRNNLQYHHCGHYDPIEHQ